MIAFFRELGYDGKKLVLKSDQQSLVNAVSVRVAQKREGETFFEHSPVRSSGSHGIIERSVKDVHGQIRSMKSAIDERINTDLSGSSNVLCWLVEFAALLISRYSVGHDGKTPYERVKGRKSNMFGFESGERVLFRRVPVSAKLAKLDSLLEHWSFRRVPLHDWRVHGGHSRGSVEDSNSPQTARRREMASRRCGVCEVHALENERWRHDDGEQPRGGSAHGLRP